MNSLESYKENLIIQDKYGVQQLPICRSLVCSQYKLIDTIECLYGSTLEKYDPPLAAAVVGLNNTDARVDPFCHKHKEHEHYYWTDIDTQEIILNTSPTCYLILGKHGLGSYDLGEALAQKLNCVHICPQIVIKEELENKSPTGKCLDFNMRHYNVIQPNLIMSIIKQKLNSSAVKHRGYVMSGLPLVTASRNGHYLMSNLHGEEAIQIVEEIILEIFLNMKKKKKKKIVESASASEMGEMAGEGMGEEHEEEQEEEQQQEEGEEEEEAAVELPKNLLEPCEHIIFPKKASYQTKQTVIINQMADLFKLEMQPDVVIFLTCPDNDAVTKRSNRYFDYKSETNIEVPFEANTNEDLKWPEKYSMHEDDHTETDTQVLNPKYHCKPPMEFREKAEEQICNYKNIVLPFIEKKLQDFNQRHLIKLDGRWSVSKMLRNILERRPHMQFILPIRIPTPLYLEDPPDDLDEFWQMIDETTIATNEIIKFNRYASYWYNRCPVELKHRKAVRGKPKYAVAFCKNVFLMSSLDALITFYKNPRPYLQVTHLEPTCRVIIIGTKSSGKTMTSKCLSWIFSAPIINYKEVEESEKKKKYESFAQTVFQNIITTIEDVRFANWQSVEEQRVAKLEEWQDMAIGYLKKYVSLLKDYDKQQSDAKFISNFNRIKKELLYLPYLDDIEACKTAIQNRDVLRYAPNDLITVTPKPKVPVYGDPDVTEAITNHIETNNLQNDTEHTDEELMSTISKLITDIDTAAKESSGSEVLYGKYIIDGFTTKPECWEHLAATKLMPDHTIAIIENREISPEIMDYYLNVEKSPKKYSERFLMADDPLIKIRLLDGGGMPLTNKHKEITHDRSSSYQAARSGVFEDNDEKNTMISEFSAGIDKFREDWDTVKLKIEETYKSFIEVEIADKSDVAIIEEVLLKLRRSYCPPCEPFENEFAEDQSEDEEPRPKDWLTHCDPRFYCETGTYCPVAFYDYGVMWEGNPEWCIKYDNKIHYFSKEESIDIFKRDVTKYQNYALPFKTLPPFRICVMGCIGTGKTSISKLIAKELGLVYIDFAEAINDFLMPRHMKKVGRKYENSFTDTSIDEEAVVEFQMGEENENLMSDILSNETELRRMVFNYFERGSPLPSVLMQKLLKKLWFGDPFVKAGFVMDGFPRLPSDVDDMLACYCIPDLILELESESEAVVGRLAPEMLKLWKIQQIQAKAKAREKFNLVKQEWMNFITKTIVAKLIFDEIVETVVTSLEPPTVVLSAGSAIIDAEPTGSLNLDANLFNLYNEMIQEYPEPVDQTEWEKADDVNERIEARIEGIYEGDEENIGNVKDMLLEQRIRVVSVNATKSSTKVARVALSKLSYLRNRNQSYFEQTFIVSQEVAEQMLHQGLYFFSKFYYLCPVYNFETPQSIVQPYKMAQLKDDIFYVCHRSYLYFVMGKDAVQKFRNDPLKYITSNKIMEYKEFPLRIGVIGPPKSGKSALAAKLRKRYDLLTLSAGIAIRNILDNMHWTELGTKMINALRNGECIDQSLIVLAIQTAMMDWRAVTHGFVLDGSPDTASQATALAKIGLYPLVIFDLIADKHTSIDRSQRELHYDIIKQMPPYSEPYIDHRYDSWNDLKYSIRDYVSKDCQNIVPINGNGSKWQSLKGAIDYLEHITPKIHHYLENNKTHAICMDVMCISNEIFEERMSRYKDMCPLCLRERVIKHSGFPVDKKGVVQFGKVFYWICQEHIPDVLQEPERHLPGPRVDIPKIPVAIKHVDIYRVYENGICMVTYAENLPSQKVVTGDKKFAANYEGKTYLFCSQKCLEKFMAKPHMYFDIVIFKQTTMLMDVSLNKLPNIGYLEQTMGNLLTKSCCSVNVLRPKYPGLSIELSGLIFIGLYLKVNNPRTPAPQLQLYKKVYKYYEAVSKVIIKTGLHLRSMDNPFANYPKCCANVIKSDSGTVCKPSTVKSDSPASSQVQIQFPFAPRRVPVPDERFDFLCEYHKPASKVPAFLNVVDIAGLVRGAAEGQGLGNAFLSHIKACDAIFNLCRAFDDEDVIHVDGDVNPVRDLETIGEELRLKDEEQLLKDIEKLDRVVNRGNDKKLKPEYDALLRIKAILVDEKKHIRFGDWSVADIEILNKYLFLTSKPAMYLVNLSEKDYTRKKNKWLPKLKEWIDKNDPGAPLIPFSGVLESKLAEMDAEERQAYLKEHQVTSALDKIIVQGYKALQLEYFFTAGADEVKAWTIQKGTKAPQAAGRIHTDFEKGFIMAEVMHYKDFKEEGSEAACKSAGKYRQQGRNYVVEDGDIIFFKFNAGAGLKDPKKK